MFHFFNRKKPLKLCYYGDPVLDRKAEKIDEINDDLRELADAMIKKMHDTHGIGLAGNQVGLPIRMVVIDISDAVDEEGKPIPPETPGEALLLPKMPIALVNPEILEYSDDLSDFEEGCLSVPKLYANVKRPSKLTLHSQLIDGSEFTAECGGLLARVVQHELDHLDGIVFVQKADEDAYRKIEAGVEKIIRKNGPRGYTVKRLV